MNSYFRKELVAHKYQGVIDFIKTNLQHMQQKFELSRDTNLMFIAKYIANYLECEETEVPKIEFILNELKSFTYNQTKLKSFIYKIRKEMRLFTSIEFTNYLEKTNTPRDNLPELFEGILKLEEYFFSNINKADCYTALKY